MFSTEYISGFTNQAKAAIFNLMPDNEQTIERPDTYNYLDFRAYLKDLFAYHKKRHGLTYRSFADRAGFGSHSFLKGIIDNRRAVSVEGIRKIAAGFELKAAEAACLELLAAFAQSTDIDEKNRLYDALIKKKPRTTLSRIEEDHYRLFSHWYIFAIRELVTLDYFIEDTSWISRTLQPNIQPKQAAEAIRILLDTGYLVRDEQGRLMQAEPNLTTDHEVSSVHVKNYHYNLLKLATDSISSTRSTWRDISATSFTVDREEFNLVKKRVAAFREELLTFLSERSELKRDGVETKRHLYNLTIQLFNTTEVDWKKNPGQAGTLNDEYA